MPLTGSGPVLATAIIAARKSVTDAFLAAHPNGASEADLAQLRLDIEIAHGNALMAHLVANGQVVVASVSGVTTGPGVSGPGTGNLV